MDQHPIDQFTPYQAEAVRLVRAWFDVNEQDAEDIVQQVYLHILKQGTREVERPKEYFLTACWNESLKLITRRQPTISFADMPFGGEEIPAPRPSEPFQVEPEELDRLPPKLREIADLLLKGLSLVEVAVALGLPASTVRRRLHVARKKYGNLAA